jgi:hypothetical protein
MERVMDLLHGKKEVQVKHSAEQGFYAQGARKVLCQDFPTAARLCRTALSHRFVQQCFVLRTIFADLIIIC